MDAKWEELLSLTPQPLPHRFSAIGRAIIRSPNYFLSDRKEIRLPDQLQKLMATEAETAREANAKIIMASGEKNASHVIRDAASIMSQPLSMQLKYLQTMSSISGKSEEIVVFPLPIELYDIFS